MVFRSVMTAALDGRGVVVRPDRDHEGPGPFASRNRTNDFPRLRVDYRERVGVHVGLAAVLSVGAHHHVPRMDADVYRGDLLKGLRVVDVELVLRGDRYDCKLAIRRETRGVGNVLAKRNRLDVGEGLRVHNVDAGQSRTVFVGRGQRSRRDPSDQDSDCRKRVRAFREGSWEQ